ncbi:MAG: UDP-N-acetylmuramoyl-tripeptide--D-alanyl-D-alanine ligase [Candidatus Bipolaricaulaceae bacterium]
MWDVREAAHAIGAKLIRPRAPYAAGGAACDSRALRRGELFVALAGRHHDGHDFLEEAFARGAVGALVNRDPGQGYNLLLVSEVAGALWELAAWRRAQLVNPVVGVTGSFGKTTTKELLGAALSVRHQVYRARASYNTEVGVPLEVLSIPDEAEVAVLELGTSAPGEIRRLASLVQPWSGIITGVAEAHLEGLRDREGVAQAKWELAEALPEEGILALCWDFPELRARVERCQGLCLRFGRSPAADFFPRGVVADDPAGVRFTAVYPQGEAPVRLQLLGEHVAALACGALALAWAMGIPAAPAVRALEAVTPLPHRLELHQAPFGWLLDDAYNANPLSLQAALATLTQLRLPVQRRMALVGDMLELGPDEERYHREMVDQAAACALDALFCYGPRSARAFAGWRGRGAAQEEDLNRLLAQVRAEVDAEPTLLLVKGSRGMALERAVAALVER